MISIATDIITVLLTAALLSLSMENGIFWPVAFVALIPLLLRIWTRSYWSIFTLTFASFALYLYFVLQWIDSYAELWRYLLSLMNASTYGMAFVLAFFIKRKYKHHFFATVLAALIVLVDFKQTIGFLGFPWPILCHSQYANLPLIQISAITGCWGVTFLLVNVNEALAHLIAGKFHTKIIHIAIIPVVLIGIFGLYGAIAISKQLPEPEVSVTVIQWDEATNQQWDRSFTDRSITGYTEITTAALSPDPLTDVPGNNSELKKLVIWPESSIPDAVRSQWTMSEIKK